MGGDARRVAGRDRHHPFPAAPETGHLPAKRIGREHDRSDAGVESWHVAAAGEYSYAHAQRLSAQAMDDNVTYSPRPDWRAEAGPIMLTSLNWTLMHLIDVAVVGHYGTEELAALGASRILTFIVLVFGFAGLSGVLVFTAQADGGRRDAETGDIFRSGLVLALA